MTALVSPNTQFGGLHGGGAGFEEVFAEKEEYVTAMSNFFFGLQEEEKQESAARAETFRGLCIIAELLTEMVGG
jgi:hypothetical protein